MNKHRLVDTCFWDDSYIMKLDPSEKLLFMYLLTNPLTAICGVYQIELKRIAFDTGFDQEVVNTILKRFERDEKCVYQDGWIAMKNWLKHQNPSPKVQAGIEMQLKEVPELLVKFIKGYSMDTISHPNSNSNPNSNAVKKPQLSSPTVQTKMDTLLGTGVVRKITDYYQSLFTEEYPGYKPTWDGKTIKLVKADIARMGDEHLGELIQLFFEEPPDFVKKNGTGLGYNIFHSMIDGLIEKRARRERKGA